MSARDRYVARDYDTRIDHFRRQTNIPLRLWADEAGVNRSQLGK
jgi:hypothetical protein